jgi:hypothetical protein
VKKIGLILFILGFVLFSCDTGNGTNENGFVSTTDDTISNDEITLGLIGTIVSSNKPNVATAEIMSGKIRVTSVSEGSAVLIVSNVSGHEATIPVTVSKTGSITIGRIVKFEQSSTSSPFEGIWYNTDEGYSKILKFTGTEFIVFGISLDKDIVDMDIDNDDFCGTDGVGRGNYTYTAEKIIFTFIDYWDGEWISLDGYNYFNDPFFFNYALLNGLLTIGNEGDLDPAGDWAGILGLFSKERPNIELKSITITGLNSLNLIGDGFIYIEIYRWSLDYDDLISIGWADTITSDTVTLPLKIYDGDDDWGYIEADEWTGVGVYYIYLKLDYVNGGEYYFSDGKIIDDLNKLPKFRINNTITIIDISKFFKI